MSCGNLMREADIPPLPSPVYDSHAHLVDKVFDGIREEVIIRAGKIGLAGIIVPGDTLKASHEALQLTKRHPDFLRAAVGIHPYDARYYSDAAEQALATLASDPLIVAIGEIGLDHRKDGSDPSPHDVQREVFLRQMALAKKLNLPVIIHCRNAYRELIDILSGIHEQAGDMSGVIHCFSGKKEDALRLIALGYHIGFTGTLTFTNAPDLRETAAALPLERILIETDSPYLTPHPFRGVRPNEPMYVRYVAEALAGCHGISLEEACLATFRNTEQLFKWRA
ncbi:MAG: TatD family hydrolase [Candidatus Sumerlaeota bacterium]|nr:TatD family hydrolase [Candidatus Sumerlaeota bacterium]